MVQWSDVGTPVIYKVIISGVFSWKVCVLPGVCVLLGSAMLLTVSTCSICTPSEQLHTSWFTAAKTPPC